MPVHTEWQWHRHVICGWELLNIDCRMMERLEKIRHDEQLDDHIRYFEDL